MRIKRPKHVSLVKSPEAMLVLIVEQAEQPMGCMAMGQRYLPTVF